MMYFYLPHLMDGDKVRHNRSTQLAKTLGAIIQPNMSDLIAFILVIKYAHSIFSLKAYNIP